MPWLNFEEGSHGPFTRGFIGVAKVLPAGERIILPANRYGYSGGQIMSAVSLFEVNPPSLAATISETFPTFKVNAWCLQQDSLAAVLFARHLDGEEFWGAVVNLNTLNIYSTLGLDQKQTAAKLTDMFLPKLGVGKLTKALMKPDRREWLEQLDRFDLAAGNTVISYVDQSLQLGSQSGRL